MMKKLHVLITLCAIQMGLEPEEDSIALDWLYDHKLLVRTL